MRYAMELDGKLYTFSAAAWRKYLHARLTRDLGDASLPTDMRGIEEASHYVRAEDTATAERLHALLVEACES